MPSTDPSEAAAYEPTDDWTFENALLLLEQTKQGPREDKMLAKCLEAYLKKNSDVITNGSVPFSTCATKGRPDQCGAGCDAGQLPKQVTIRGITYKNTLSESRQEYVREIANALHVDLAEALRICVTAAKRIPSKEPVHLTEASARSFEESSESSNEVSYFATRVTREQRTAIRIALLLIKSKHVGGTTKTTREMRATLEADGHLIIEKQLDNIGAVYKLITKPTTDTLLDQLIKREYCLTLLDLLNYLCYLILASQHGFTKPTVSKWFRLMQETAYLSGAPAKTATLEALATVTTLLFLDLDFNFGSLDDQSSYMNDATDLKTITDVLQNSAPNPVILYAWSIVLHRKHVVMTAADPDNASAKAIVSKLGSLQQIQKLFTSFAAKAAKLDVSSAVLKCHKRLTYDQIYSDILGSFVVAFVPYVKLTDNNMVSISEIMSTVSDAVVQRFFENAATEEMLSLARAKLPISLRSFLAVCSINTNLAIEEMRSFSSYMAVLPQKDFYYKYAIDDENPDLVRLTQDIEVFPPYETSKEMSLHLKAGTRAQIFPSSSKDNVVVAFIYEYSGWALLGRILRNLSMRFDNTPEKSDLLIQIYKMLAKVFSECDGETAEQIFFALDSFVGKNDAIDTTFRILDQVLALRNVPLLSALIDFITSIASNRYTYRVWSYLYKSNMLGLKPSGELASTVLGTTEVVSGRYDFTISLIGLTSVLTRNCIRVDSKVSRKLKAQVVDRLIMYLLQVFENFSNWKYIYDSDRLRIGSEIVRLFNLILESLYGVDEHSKPEQKVNGAFALAAERLISSFLVSGVEDVRSMKPIFASLNNVTSSFTETMSNDLAGQWSYFWFNDAFQFCTTLLKVRSSIQKEPSTFESMLYSYLPKFINLYLNNFDKRIRVAELLTYLVGAKYDSEPPSLLTHLKQTHTETLLRCLSIDMANRAESYALKINLYDFFSSVMEGNQEGLSIVFITGEDIKDSLQTKQKSGNNFSLLDIMKQDVSIIGQYPNNVALHLVDAIALAFSSWTTAEQESDDTNFVKQLLSKLDEYPDHVPEDCTDGKRYIEYCYEVRLLSKVAEIISLYLFVSKNAQCKDLILNRLNQDSFVDSLGSKFRIVGYKKSLQDSVKTDFHSAWPQFRLEQFIKASGYREHRFGVESIYSFTLMRMLLGDNPKWPAMKKEITDASINMQYASAQISAAKACGALITCLCKVAPTGLSPQCLQLAGTLLRASDEEEVPAPLFESIFRARIELAFFICMTFSRRKDYKPSDAVLFNVITSAECLLDSKDISLAEGLLSLKVTFYKPLLRILLICIEMIPRDTHILVEYSATFCDIFSETICRSSKMLFNSVRSQGLSSPNGELGNSQLVSKQVDDLTLLLSMLQAFLRLPLPDELDNSIATASINTGLFSSVCTAYSVSHLIKVNDEEIFADYALMFLYNMAGDRVMAQKMIAHGIYSVMIESPISVRIQRGNIRPYAVSRSRLHHLWSDGLLPIVLTLLGYFGESVLAETCMLTTAFGRQIGSTLQAWYESDSSISTQFIEETSQIILLAKALNSLDAYNYVRNATNENNLQIRLIPGLDTPEERKKLSSAMNYLISHPKYLTLRIVPSNPEEQRVLQSDDGVKFIESVLNQLKELKGSLE